MLVNVSQKKGKKKVSKQNLPTQEKPIRNLKAIKNEERNVRSN
jgi:hypothetical protein